MQFGGNKLGKFPQKYIIYISIEKNLVAERFQDLIDQKKQVWIFFIFGLLDQFSSIRDTKLTNSTFFKEVIKLS